MKRNLLVILPGLVGLALLTGCTTSPAAPAATADSVLAAQYRASGAHGALTGEEADRIMQTYERTGGPAAALPPSGADTGMAGDPGHTGNSTN